MRKILNIVFVLSLIAVPVWADVLIPPKLFAEKSKDPEGAFSWTNSDKYTCDTPVTLFFKSMEDAKEALEKCPNKKGFTTYFSAENDIKIYGKQYENPTNEHLVGRVDKVVIFFPDDIKLCPTDKPLLDNYGICHSCDEEEVIDVSWMVGTYLNRREFDGKIKYFCSTICPNRHIKISEIDTERTTENNYFCVLKECPREKPIQDYAGRCHSCDEKKGVQLEPPDYRYGHIFAGGYNLWGKRYYDEYCSKLSQHSKLSKKELLGQEDPFCQNRIKIEKKSVLKECPFDMPLRGRDNECYSCDESREITVDGPLSFWGEIRCGKVYGVNQNIIGHLDDVFSETGSYIYDEENKKIGRVIRKTGVRGRNNDRCLIYDMDGKLVALGIHPDIFFEDPEENSDGKKEKADFYYDAEYFHLGVYSDDVCPNREIFRDENEEIISRLKK